MRKVVHLSPKTEQAQAEFLKKVRMSKRKTKQPIIIGLVGLVGSGKSTLAKELANGIGGTVIEADLVRVELRKQGADYGATRRIVEVAVMNVLESGGNVIVDSDFIDSEKRSDLQKKIRARQARLIFMRVTCNYDVMVGRIMDAKYQTSPDNFFGGADTVWRGRGKGAVVKLRELWRRTPHHYRWSKEGGGQWVLRKLTFSVYKTIDTTEPGLWRKQVEMVCKKLVG